MTKSHDAKADELEAHYQDLMELRRLTTTRQRLAPGSTEHGVALAREGALVSRIRAWVWPDID